VRRMANVHRFELELTELVVRRLQAERPDLPDAERADLARLVALTAFAFIRHAWFSWLEHPDSGPELPELLENVFELGTELIASSHPPCVG